MDSKFRYVAQGVLAFGLAASSALAQAQDPGSQGHKAPRYAEDVFPPWQHGANNDALNRGLDFTVPEVDDLADFHGDVTKPKLVLFVGGNYFFAMAPLVQAFEAAHPEYKGRKFWETIPPGLLVKQMQAGGTITSGNMTWTVKADAYFCRAGEGKGVDRSGPSDWSGHRIRYKHFGDHDPHG